MADAFMQLTAVAAERAIVSSLFRVPPF
ncbi:hypothetical protein PRIPAC_75564 [Pristionchus pacificus]|nr:hypothetical protein PRIPAC_75564 [Pristionchus pacificus]